MLNQDTIERMWQCYREIKVGKDLLVKCEEIAQRQKENWRGNAEKLKDAFGYQQELKLGVPCGDNSTQLLDVSYTLAVSIIRAHIGNKEAELKELNEKAKIEAGMD